jgi:hypothetical protein
MSWGQLFLHETSSGCLIGCFDVRISRLLPAHYLLHFIPTHETNYLVGFQQDCYKALWATSKQNPGIVLCVAVICEECYLSFNKLKMILHVVYPTVSYIIYVSRLILKINIFVSFYSILRSACPMEAQWYKSFVFIQSRIILALKFKEIKVLYVETNYDNNILITFTLILSFITSLMCNQCCLVVLRNVTLLFL